jgi:hypothetical protein
VGSAGFATSKKLVLIFFLLDCTVYGWVAVKPLIMKCFKTHLGLVHRWIHNIRHHNRKKGYWSGKDVGIAYIGTENMVVYLF